MLSYNKITNKDSDQWVVFIHGAGGSSQTWKEQVKDFSQFFNLMLIDLRDHGNSKDLSPEYETYNFDIITDDLIQTLDHAGIKSASFVSLSLGSIILQSLMLKRPDLIEKCVFAGAVIKGNWKIKLFVHVALMFNRFLTYEQMYQTFSYVLMPRKIHEKARRIYRLQARKLTQNEYFKWLGLYGEFFKLLRKFAGWKIDFPTLILMGEQDYVFLKSAKQFSKKQQEVELSVLPNSGHICNIDNSSLFNKESIKFLLAR